MVFYFQLLLSDQSVKYEGTMKKTMSARKTFLDEKKNKIPVLFTLLPINITLIYGLARFLFATCLWKNNANITKL
ncbi:unnamed protein product [Adineta ricciae]|uniref:Uncharacterized protein n=1 Tax=Adineta ricciae TaxID=249248 RepID=A0A815UXD6_ADIRI|nr:unnamed protein product [Adineta ricciae]